jgi:membrane protease YdiL (CAAX protease family)
LSHFRADGFEQLHREGDGVTDNDSEGPDVGENPAGKSPVWGFWGTLIWGLLISVAFVLVQTAVAGVYLSMTTADLPEAERQLLYERAATDGDVLGWATIISALICTFLTCLAIALRRGSNLKDYLGLYSVGKGRVLRWTLLFIALLIGMDVISSLLDRPVTPEVMREVYLSTENKLLLFLATVVAAPFFEELFFRGFLMEGFSRTPIGPWGSVLVTAAFWAAVHVQYDVYGIVTIFAIGVFLGLARVRSGSTTFAMALHALNNAIAFLFLAALSGQ